MASIENLKASDGSGNANVATVQSSRSPGATTIIVDTVLGINPDGFSGSMGTPHTFTDPITSEVITVISEASCVDFIGHVDGANLEIDTIAPGYTDTNGSAIGDIIIIRPTTQYSDELADILEAAHDDDGTLKDNSVTAGVIADNAIDSEALFTDNVDPVKRASEIIFDHVAAGCVLTGTGYNSTLGWSLALGVVYINGKRLTYAGGTGNVSATKDTYFDLLDNGDGTAILVNTGVNIATVNAASPALAANSVRVGIIQSGANILDITKINQGQEDKLLPIALSTPYQVTDSLGNLICPRDPNRKLLGRRQIVADFGDTTVTSLVNVPGLAVPFIVPTGRKVKATIWQNASGGNGGMAIYIRESTTVLSRSDIPGATLLQTLTEYENTISAGLHTFLASISQGSAGTMTFRAQPTYPAYVKIELI